MSKRPTCSVCKRRIGHHEGRVVVAGKWICGSCAYRIEKERAGNG